MADKVKIFISWGGPRAHEYAKVIRRWLVGFDNADPFVSSEDVQAGQKNISKIIDELQSAKAGIVIVTQESLDSKWVNFEAGYMAFMVTDSERRVIPLLLDGLKKGELTGPLASFQAVEPDDEDLSHLTRSLCHVLGIDPDRVEGKIRAMVPELKEALRSVVLPPDEGKPHKKRGTPEMVEEILTIVRGLRVSRPPALLSSKKATFELAKDFRNTMKMVVTDDQLDELSFELNKDHMKVTVPWEVTNLAETVAKEISENHQIPIVISANTDKMPF